MKHTPTPWDAAFIESHEGCNCCTSAFEVEDAAHIVRCVNSHDELLEALEKSLAALNDSGLRWPGIVNAMNVARAAIAKARGE